MTDEYEIHPDAMSLENQIRVHEWIEWVYGRVNAVERPFADRAVTNLVPAKPIESDQARRMIRPGRFCQGYFVGRGRRVAVRARTA